MEYSQQISGFTLIRNTPIKSAPQTGNNLADCTKKKKKKHPKPKKQTKQKIQPKKPPGNLE